MRRAIAIDFDGCLCEDAYPGIGAARKNVIRAAKLEQQNGAALILWTCREGAELEAALWWCETQGLHFDAVNDSLPEWKEKYGTDPRKIGASEYWDDRAVKPGRKIFGECASLEGKNPCEVCSLPFCKETCSLAKTSVKLVCRNAACRLNDCDLCMLNLYENCGAWRE